MRALKKIDSLTLTVVIVLFLEFTQIVWAASKVDEGAQHAPPGLYYLQWIVLIAVFLLGIAYLVRLVKLGRPSQKKTGLGALLVALIFLYFGLGYYPSLQSFHEASAIGFLKFVLMISTGILVVIYGVLGKPSVYHDSSSNQK